MITDEIIKGEKVLLRIIKPSDCNEVYLNWLNDIEVNRYLETRLDEQSIEKIKNFVTSVRESKDSYLFAIIFEGRHIGNIKIGPIHPLYKYADVSYFIGEKSLWGKGIASDAIKSVTKFAFQKLNLYRIQAGLFENNKGSEKALIKAGYKKEGVFRKQLFETDESNRSDHVFYGIIRDEFEK